MKERVTLGKFLESCRIMGEDIDIYVDGIDGIAYCGETLTEEGEKVFKEALELPMYGCYVISDDDNDYDLLEKGEGRLQLAWDMLTGMAGYCSCDDYDKWFIMGE